MRSKVWMSLSLTAVTLPLLAADENPDDLPIINMDTVVITATQTEEDAFTTAKSIDKVDSEQLEIQQPESVAEATEELSNVNISQGPRQLSQQVNVRGLSGKEVLQVLDNARQNFQNGHQGSFFIEPELLKEIEVLKGPGSSLWGSGAIGGVVNMTTIDPSDILIEGEPMAAMIKGGYQSGDDSWMNSDTVAGRVGEDNEFLMNFTYRNTHDITAGDNVTIPDSAFWDRSGLAKWVSEINEYHTLRFSYMAFDAHQNVPSDPRRNIDDVDNPLVDQNIYQQNWNATYEYEKPNNDWVDLTTTFYYNDTEVTDECLELCSESTGGIERQDKTIYTTTGMNARNSTYFDWFTLTLGGELYQDQTSGERNGAERDQFPDAHTDVWASYAQFEIPFWETWSLTPGIRYDHFHNNPNQDEIITIGSPSKPAEVVPLESTSEGEVSNSVTLSWQTTEWMSLHAIYDEAFRAPAIDELYPSGYHFGFDTMGFNVLNQFMPNPDLQPEKARNKEFSARFSWDEIFNRDDHFRMRASVFRNDVENLIQQQILDTEIVQIGPPPFPPTFDITSSTIYENIPDARLTGTELDATYRIEDWFVGIAYGYVKGINENPGPDETGYLDDVPPERIIYNFGRYFCRDTILTGLRVTNAWAQDRVSQPQNCDPNSNTPANACPIPGYTTADIYAAWTPDTRDLNGMRVNFALNNITDRYYYNNTSSILPEEGRNVELSISYTF